MRPQAPSLDIIAAQSEVREDSRSSSSTNSPAPAEYEESDFYHGANDSQSSLGIANFGDMQVADNDACQPPINRLPNEILIAIFSKLSSPAEYLHSMLVCKRWARNAVDLLWHRPACTTWEKHSSICQTLGLENPYFAYREFIKRLNLAALADGVNDGSVIPLAVCTRVERLTLTACRGLSDVGLTELLKNNSHLLALDISGDQQITEVSIYALAKSCQKLQGLNISGCTKISNESLVSLAESCRYIKRLKLNDCNQITDSAVLAFAKNCPNILEIDLHQCRLIQNPPITALLACGQSLRELRLAGCELIDDGAFLSLPPDRTYEHLRILDLTSCVRLTDRAVERIIEVAPRLRNLVLSKCRLITDAAVHAISKLGKNLHYVHLGHCGQITDASVKRLVQSCNRIRYIDLGCCTHLTDESVMKLAQLPKLKRIGLVKCGNITDESVYALAKANHRFRTRRDARGVMSVEEVSYSSLERVHLSYCLNLTLKSILKLLNSCPRLTHLSLTGVQAFLRDDLEVFCRKAPPEFTDHQRNVFCVFSGAGVIGLRNYLNTHENFADIRDNSSYYGRRGDAGGVYTVRRHAGPAARLPPHVPLGAGTELRMPDAAGASAAGPATQWRVTGGHFDDDGSPGGLFDPDIEFPVDDPLGVNQPAPWSMLNQNPMFEPALPTVQHANGPNGAYAGVGGGPVSLPIIQDEMSTPRPPAYEPVATGAEASSSTMPVSGASFAGPSTGGLGGHLASAVAASGSGASTASMHGPPRSVAATTTTTTTATTPLPPTAAPATTQQPPHGGDGADADADEEDLDDEDMSMHHDDGDR